MDQKEVLWNLANEHYQQARQHETLRSAISGAVLALFGVLLTYAAKENLLLANARAVGMAIIGLGLVGIAMTVLHYARNRFHVTAAKLYVRELARIVQPPWNGDEPGEIRSAAEQEFARKYRMKLLWMPGARPGSGGITMWWGLVHLVIVAVGVRTCFQGSL